MFFRQRLQLPTTPSRVGKKVSSGGRVEAVERLISKGSGSVAVGGCTG